MLRYIREEMARSADIKGVPCPDDDAEVVDGEDGEGVGRAVRVLVRVWR